MDDAGKRAGYIGCCFLMAHFNPTPLFLPDALRRMLSESNKCYMKSAFGWKVAETQVGRNTWGRKEVVVLSKTSRRV